MSYVTLTGTPLEVGKAIALLAVLDTKRSICVYFRLTTRLTRTATGLLL